MSTAQLISTETLMYLRICNLVPISAVLALGPDNVANERYYLGNVLSADIW